jgi:hypothetical protein
MKKRILLLLVLVLFNLVSAVNVTLVSPVDNYKKDLQAPTEDITFKCRANDDLNLINLSLYGDWHEDGWGVIKFDTSVNNDSDVEFIDNLGFGEHEWNCLACDNESNCVFAVENYSLILDLEGELVFWRKTYVVSNFEYENGITKKFLDAFRYRIKLNDRYCFIGVVKVNENSVKLNITGIGNVEMSDNETKKFDVNGDEVNDFSLYIDGIINRAAYIKIKKLDPELEINESNSTVELNNSEELNLSDENNISGNFSADISGNVVDSEGENSNVLLFIFGGLLLVSIIIGLFFYFNFMKDKNQNTGVIGNNSSATKEKLPDL